MSWSFPEREVLAQIKCDVVFSLNEDGYHYEGFEVVTNKRRFRVGISTGQACCEVTGYFTSEDNPKTFIGKRLVRVDVVDDLLNKTQLDEISYLDQGGVMFVNFETEDGTLQFVCYNAHNGYYGHEAVVHVSGAEGENCHSEYL